MQASLLLRCTLASNWRSVKLADLHALAFPAIALALPTTKSKTQAITLYTVSELILNSKGESTTRPFLAQLSLGFGNDSILESLLITCNSF